MPIPCTPAQTPKLLFLLTRTQSEKQNDESVKLRILQTALTLMQNPQHADDAVSGNLHPLLPKIVPHLEPCAMLS